MRPYPSDILTTARRTEIRHHTRETLGATGAAAVRFVRDGPVPRASCPHCGGELAVGVAGQVWRIHRSRDVADRMAIQLSALEREELHVLVLNTRNIVIAQERVYQGNVSSSVVRVGELFRTAIERHASGIILIHNHPSGEVKPSLDDLHLTNEAIKAGQLLDIDVLDHLIVGGGGYTSLRDSGIAFPPRPAEPIAGERRSPWWRDSRYATYKSALQKYTRRGEVEKAVAAGAVLAALPGGVAMLWRRLTVIAAEDVDWLLIPAVARIAKESERLPAEEAVPRLLGATADLAATAKRREAFWLGATCWGGRRVAPEVSQDALTAALVDGRHQDAFAICLAAQETRRWRSGPRVIDALRAIARTAPTATAEIITWALWREAHGGAGVAELIASAVIAAIDQPAGPLPELTGRSIPHRPERVPLDWYTQDGHTDTGRRALAVVARMEDLDPRALGALMFHFESTQLGPAERPCRWRDEAMVIEAVAQGWGTYEAGARSWAAVRPVIAAAVATELGRQEA